MYIILKKVNISLYASQFNFSIRNLTFSRDLEVEPKTSFECERNIDFGQEIETKIFYILFDLLK